MVTTADFATFQQQLRQEVADVIQQLRAEMNEAISGRMDMMNSISTALQFRIFTSDLHLWMQAWSDQGAQMLASVESVDRFDNKVITFDYSYEEFRSIDASLYQVLHRTTSNEPLGIVQQTRGQKGFEAMACNSAKVRSEEHVGQKLSVCSNDQQHLREGQGEGRGAV